MTCKGCNNETYIQNKKYCLCGECVFKKSHGGKSKQEVYQIRQRVKKDIETIKEYTNFNKLKSIDYLEITAKGHYVQDEECLKNEIAQNLVELAVRRDAKEKGEKFNAFQFESKIKDRINKKSKKPIKQQSIAQAAIERAYKITCIDMDHTTEPVCTGCNRYQGGDIKLSHSHLISRADCKRIGRIDLISDRDNLTYHCMNFMNHSGCHNKWENPKERVLLLDYEKNIKYIKGINTEVYLKYKSD